MMTGKGVRRRGDRLRGDSALRLEVRFGGTGPAPELGDA